MSFAYGVSTFIQKIETYSDITCLCGIDEILEEMDRILGLRKNGQLISYDTTFSIWRLMYPIKVTANAVAYTNVVAVFFSFFCFFSSSFASKGYLCCYSVM